MATVFLAGDGHYQQDNAPCHKARIVKEQFEEHDGEFLLMPWPPNSPDMNHSKSRFELQSPPPHNVQELEDPAVDIMVPDTPDLSQPRWNSAILMRQYLNVCGFKWVMEWDEGN